MPNVNTNPNELTGENKIIDGPFYTEQLLPKFQLYYYYNLIAQSPFHEARHTG